MISASARQQAFGGAGEHSPHQRGTLFAAVADAAVEHRAVEQHRQHEGGAFRDGLRDLLRLRQHGGDARPAMGVAMRLRVAALQLGE
jgi:hypothetical protein